MADEQPSCHTSKSPATTSSAEILRNAEQGIFKIRHTALIPSIYHVYLHPSDYELIKPVSNALTAEARACVDRTPGGD